MAIGAIGAPPARKPRGATLDRIAPKVRAEIVARIRAGVPGGIAAVSCGVSRRAFVRWLEFGRAPDARDPYRSFAADCDRAFAEWQVDKVGEVSVAGAKDWRASFELLKRSAPADFADPDRAVATQVNVQVVEAERSDLSARLLGAAQRVLGDDPELLARFMAEVAGGDVVDGSAVEVAELAP